MSALSLFLVSTQIMEELKRPLVSDKKLSKLLTIALILMSITLILSTLNFLCIMSKLP